MELDGKFGYRLAKVEALRSGSFIDLADGYRAIVVSLGRALNDHAVN